jgi:iron complex transport system substrate-binding protein
MTKWYTIPKLSASLLAVMLLLTACGGNKPSENPSTLPQSADPAKERVVKHALGETKVPSNPLRVVVLDTGELDIALALGVKPVGAVIAGAESGFPGYLMGKTDSIQKVGTIAEPNLEAIAALKPDLILTNTLRHEKIKDKLNQIAPTVFGKRPNFWKENLKIYADALGKADVGTKLMSDYENRIKEFRPLMGDRLATTKVSLVRSFPDHARIYLNESFSGSVLVDLGLGRPKSQDKTSSDPATPAVFEKVTEERIPDMDGDVIFVFYYGREKGDSLAKLFKNPLWAQLQGVKENKVIEVDDGHWGLGLGPVAANLIVDDLFKYVANK